MSYNSYRHRSYNISRSKARAYAQEMENLESSFSELQKDGWNISSRLDSCYRNYGNFELRVSNHSAAYQHDLDQGYLIVNVKKSKLEFTSFIKKDLAKLVAKLDELSLEKYRFINVVGSSINCYLKNYKTKKEVVSWA